MEKTTLAALDWKLSRGTSPAEPIEQLSDHDYIGDQISPVSKESPYKAQIHIRRRYQFSSALKRMSTISSVSDSQGKKWVAAVKGAPETLKSMYVQVPDWYEETYRWYTRRGSRVLALGVKYMDVQADKVRLFDSFQVGLLTFFYLFFSLRLTRSTEITWSASSVSPVSSSSTVPSSLMPWKLSRCSTTRLIEYVD